MTLLSATTTLFLVLDPLGNIPAFLGVLSGTPPEQRRRILVRELLAAYAVMVAFLFLGTRFMRVLHLDNHTVQIAGGIVLFLISLRMVFPTLGPPLHGGEDREPFLVPLAVPLLAGPSTLATLMLLAHQEPQRMGHWWLAITLAWGLSAAILLLAQHLGRRLGRSGLEALTRLMGMLLVMIAVQMFLDGIATFNAKHR